MNATSELHYIDSYNKVQAVVDRVASIRDQVGDQLEIGIDFHGRVHRPMAKVLAHALEPNGYTRAGTSRIYSAKEPLILFNQMLHFAAVFWKPARLLQWPKPSIWGLPRMRHTVQFP